MRNKNLSFPYSRSGYSERNVEWIDCGVVFDNITCAIIMMLSVGGALYVWGIILPDTDSGFSRGSVQYTVQEIHPLDVRDEIKYVSARFEAVTWLPWKSPLRKKTAAMKTTGNRRGHAKWKINWACSQKWKLLFKIFWMYPFCTTSGFLLFPWHHIWQQRRTSPC